MWNNNYYVTNDEVISLLNEKNTDLIMTKLSYLVQSKIKKYKSQIFYLDLLQEGKLGLLKAIYDFDLKRGINFFKFANWHIKHRIRLYLRWQKRNEPIEIERSYTNNESDYQYEQFEMKKNLVKEVENLPHIYKNVLILRFGIGCDKCSLKDIGEKFSLSKQRIEQIEKSAILKLRKNKNIQQYKD